MKRTFDIVIAGAGMAGLTVAALLARSEQRHRMTLRIVDAGMRPQFDAGDDLALRVSAVAAGSATIYQALGVWQSITAIRACPIREMHVWDAARPPVGPETLHFDAAEFALAELGHVVENVLVQDVLLAELDRLGVKVEFETPLADLQMVNGRCTLQIPDGKWLDCDLLVGADGVNSMVRRCAGIPATAWRYPQSAFVTHLLPQDPHRNIAWQRFLPDGPLALLPLSDGRISIVWSTTPEQAAAVMAVTDTQLGRLVTEASDGVLGLLTATGPRATFPLKAQYATAYVKPGIVLIGDAAHSIHPLAGQGANLGIADAHQLAKVITRAIADGEHPGDWPVLRRYERGRKGANQGMLYFVDALNRLFSSPAQPVSVLRSAGMRLFNRSGPLRRRAVATALGVVAAE
ncbi:MAG: UbiH/UbiF/VisC/COQ6 family ubiquinone biosynthesis hydroxylase [Woeseia sp.]